MKGISAILVAIFLVIISVSLTYAFLLWSQAARETIQEGVEGSAERSTAELNAGLSIVAVADNQISIKNTGRNSIDVEKIDVLLEGRRAQTAADASSIGPGQVAVINVTRFLPGVRQIRVSGPLGIGDETRDALVYPGTVGFWDFMPEDEGFPRDSSSGGNDGTLNGTTRLALHFDESRGDTTVDASGLRNDAILNGPSWTNGVTRSGLQFDGIDDYVEIPNEADFDFTEAITVEGWIKNTATDSSNARIVSKYFCCSGGSGDNVGYELNYRGSDDHIHWQVRTSPSDVVAPGATGLDINDGAWHYIVGTYDRREANLYVDGVLVNSTAGSAKIGTTDTPATIGKRSGVTTGLLPFKGSVDEVGIHGRALTAAEVENRYEGKRVASADYIPGVHNSALLLEASAVTVPSSGSLDVYASVTMEAWVNVRGGSTTNDTILAKDGSYALFFNSTSDRPWARLYLQGGAAADSYSHPAAVLTRNEWHHVVATADGSKLSIYVDGELSSSVDYDGQMAFTTAPLMIGGRNGNNFNGTMDYVAVYKTALTAEEVKEIYEAGSG